MNPPQGTGTPPNTPPRDNEAFVPDTPDAAFGFADETSRAPTQPVQPPPAGSTPLPASPQPITPVAAPAPAVMPPQPQTSPPAAPASVLPPRQIPAVPTFEPKPATAAVPPPTASDAFDPAKVPMTSSADSVNPLSASYIPGVDNHISDDIAAQITATPMQNSADITKKIHKGTASSRLKSIVSFLIFTAAIFVAAFLINQFVFQSYYVDGTSMTPTLQNNDRLIISKVERTIANVEGKPYIPERGQIVVLDSSIVGLNGENEQLVKRVIGLPGDHIHIENGAVTITNSQHQKGYDVTKDLGLTNLQATYVDAPIDLTVPNNQVFVMGDNRGQGGSYDSRAFGPIDGDKIQGRLWGRILPLDHAQLF